MYVFCVFILCMLPDYGPLLYSTEELRSTYSFFVRMSVRSFLYPKLHIWVNKEIFAKPSPSFSWDLGGLYYHHDPAPTHLTTLQTIKLTRYDNVIKTKAVFFIW